MPQISINALKGASFISTITQYADIITTALSVNALNGATFISTYSHYHK